MTIFKVISASALALTGCFAAACSANSAETKTVQASTYVKPGASVTYSHNLKSQLSAGETANFKLTLGESYTEGLLKVSLTMDGGVTSMVSTEAEYDMSSATEHEMDVSIIANSNGRHYINVEALAVNPSGQSRPRIFSIPVQVGPITAQKPNVDMKTMENGENIIEMEAQEEIK